MRYAAPPSSAIGQLQRGRGAGWLRVAGSKNGVELLLSCLENDPRWDGQVEARDWYYATLARRLGMTANQIAEAKIDNEYGLGISVITQLARLGDQTAVPSLRAMLMPGPTAHNVADTLADATGGLDQLNELIAERFDEQALFDLVLWTDERLPWNSWDRSDPRIKRAVAQVAEHWRRVKRDRQAVAADADLRIVLKAPLSAQIPDELVERFATRPSTSELRRLRAAAVGPFGGGRVFALRVLRQRLDPCALDLAEKTFAANAKGIERASMSRYVSVLPAEYTLPLARRWLDLPDSRGGVAASLLALHSEVDDVPAICAALRYAWDEQDMYKLCSLIESLGRHEGLGPYPELHTIYTEVSYSYARKRAAKVMAAVDPDFPRLFAREALWDCEVETRRAGIAHADRGDANVPERIAELIALQHDRDWRDG